MRDSNNDENVSLVAVICAEYMNRVVYGMNMTKQRVFLIFKSLASEQLSKGERKNRVTAAVFTKAHRCE